MMNKVDVIVGEEVDPYNRMTLGLGLAMCSSICNGFAAVLNRRLKETPAPILAIWQSFLVAFVLGIYILIEAAITGNGFRFAAYTGSMYGLAEIGAICNVACMFCYIISFQSDSSGFVALLSYLRIGYAYACDQLIFHEKEFTIAQLICAVVILVVAFSVAFFKLWQKKIAKEKAKTDDYFEKLLDEPKQPTKHCKCCEDHQWAVSKDYQSFEHDCHAPR